MNIFRTPVFRAIGTALALPLAALFLSACTVDSTTAVPSDNSGTIYNYSGLYLNPDNGTNGILPIVYPYEGSSRPSGTLITSLRIMQYGSVLEGFDSANQTWAGSISSIQGGTASFTLEGRTTAGQSVQVAGTMVYDANNSTMNASWIEPAYFGTLYAQASVPPAITNSPTPTNSSVTLVANTSTLSINDSATLTASGGDGTFSWPSSVSYGSISSSGSSAQYTRTSGTSNNTATITVSSDGDSDSVTFDFD